MEFQIQFPQINLSFDINNLSKELEKIDEYYLQQFSRPIAFGKANQFAKVYIGMVKNLEEYKKNL